MSMPLSAPEELWVPEEIVAATGARLTGNVKPATGASIDTRTLRPGDLFFAIAGDARDGHDFVRDALAKGASAAVVAKEQAAKFEGAGPLVVVADVLGAMRRIGLAARRRTDARVVAVTGSVGKTGTKEALRLVLSRFGATHASVASYNNHWGVPLTLARMPKNSAFGVFEIGMNHAGEIAPLTRMVRPHVALVTTVEPVHIEYFRSIWGIADAKGEIFSGLEPGGAAVVNRDNPYFERLRAHAAASRAGRILTFGEHADADVRAERIILKPEGSIVEARLFGKPLTFRIGMPGRHIALNNLGLLAACHALGVDITDAARALADLTPPTGRGTRTVLPVEGGAITLIDESYNANPASMRAALATLGGTAPGPGGRRIAVLGDMQELGPEGPALHRALAESIEANGVDLVFAAGTLMESLWAALSPDRRGGYAETAADLKQAVVAAARPGDIVMIKGSNSIRMALIVQALKDQYGADPAPAQARKG
jgi:UDP-N-acetylmuramoyl-tripeptide--D-alanyl-D-alanine ligase